MEVLFDIRSAPFASWFGFAPFLVLAVGVAIELVRRSRRPRDVKRNVPIVDRVLFAMVSVFILVANVHLVREYRHEKASLVEMLEAGRARVVEGEVSEYQHQAWTGKPQESFRLGAERFEFDGFGRSPAYHLRARDGGVLRDGMRVRIWVIEGNIVRIERVSGSPGSGSTSVDSQAIIDR